MILMATARKLPSGSWRCQIYSHTEEYVQEDGTIKKKRIYKSFTSNLPGTKGKRDAERQAAEWAAGKESVSDILKPVLLFCLLVQSENTNAHEKVTCKV